MAFLNEVSYRHYIRNPRKNLFDFNTPDGNYWIGFLLADGHINVDSEGSLEVYQYIGNKRNIDHFLEYVKDSSTEVIGTFNMSKTGDVVYIPKNPDIDKLVKTFDWKNNMKKCPNIDKIIKYFNNLNFNNSLAFICGFIDGDGSIKDKGNCVIEIKSNWEELLKAFQEKLNLHDRKIGKRKEDSGKDSVYMNIPLNIMKRIDGVIQSKGPRWDRVNPIEESFDFDLDNDYKLGQPIIDRYKNIQILENLITKFVYSRYPNNKDVVTPGLVLDSFIWQFFPFYYDNKNDFIDGFSYASDDKYAMTIIHAGEDFERNERKRIKIEFPKKNTRKSFIEECSRKMAEGLVDAGIDMKHLVIKKTELSESFDFNSETNDEELTLNNTVNKLKRIALLSSRINGIIYGIKERMEEFNENIIYGESFIDNIIFSLFSHIEDPYEAVDFTRGGSEDGYDYILFVPVKGHQGTPKKSSQKVHLPMMIDVNKDLSSYVMSIAKALVEIDADEEYNLFESFDFNNDLEDDLGVEKDIEAIKKKHEYERLCTSTFYEVLKKNLIQLQDGILNPSSRSKKIYSSYGILVHTLLDHICAGDLYYYIKYTAKPVDKEAKMFNYSIYYEGPFQSERITLCSFDWDRKMELGDKRHIRDFFELIWEELATPENGLFIGNKLLSNHLRKRLIENNLAESFDFDNEEEYDLEIDKISTYYKICEKELERILEKNTSFGEDSTYNIALILRDFLYQIGLEAFELFMSDVKYPKGKIHFIYDDTERCQWNTIIVGNKEETKREIKKMFIDILKDEEIFYDLTEIIKEKKLNESFDFNAEDNYDQEIADKVSKIKKFQEWNFDNGFKILENFYSLGLKVDPNMKVYAYPSVSLLINILYPIDKSLDQENTREVRVTIGENPSRNYGTILYFRNNKTGKVSYKVFPYEYSVKEFKDKWAYLVIEALEEIGANKSTLMRKNDPLYEAFDFSNDNEDSLMEKISEICLIRKIIEKFRESVEKVFKDYYGNDTKEMYTISAYKIYLNNIQDYINKKSKELFDIEISWLKNTANYSMDVKVLNGAGEEFLMKVPYKVSFEELSDVEFPKVLKGIINNMPDYKEMLMRNF